MIKVFKVSDLIKYVFKIIVPAIVILFLISILTKNNSLGKIDNSNENYIFCLDDEIEQINYNKEKSKVSSTNIISSTFKIFVNMKLNSNNESDPNNNSYKNNDSYDSNNEHSDNKENDESNTQNHEDTKVEQAKTDVNIEKVQSNITPRTTNEYKGVKINNASKKVLSEDMMNPDGINVNKKKVIIYHTHTSESYTSSEKFQYTPTGNFRTTDLNYNVTRVGDELQKQLETYGITVIHDKTFHDYPAYNGSYSRSLKTAERLLKDNSDCDIFIDLHRDAISDSTYAPKVKIDGEFCSQLMFVIGSDVSKSINSNWNQNFKYAVKLQMKANELYPGLFKPIILRNGEYNQHIAKASTIIEVGSTGNTLEESIASMKYLARIISEL